jgi:hypothetical protein
MILMLGGIVGAALPIPVDNWNAPADIAYGTPLSSTQLDATATDPTTGNPVDGTFAYTPPAGTILNVGSGQTLSTTFTPTDTTDYTTASGTASINVIQATPTITWNNPADIAYGTPLSSTQLDATATDPTTGNPVDGTFAYTPPAGTILGAGTQTLSATFTPTDTTNYTTASGTASINVIQATPTITWNNPADICQGTALNSTQLDATVSVPGTCIYTPPAGTILDAGTQTLSATFTPTDSINYTTATKTVSINVKVCEENNGGDFGPNYGGCGYGGCAGAFVPVPMMGPGYGSGPYGYGSEPYGYSSEPSATTEVQTSCKDKACFNKHKHKIHSKHHNTAKHHSKHHKAKNC